MKTLLIALALIATVPAAAQQSTPTDYNLRVTADDIQILGRAIDELPARIARPLAQRLMQQVIAQDTEFSKKAAEAAKPAEPKE